MKHFLIIILFFAFGLNLYSQKDTTSQQLALNQKVPVKEAVNVNITIFPVPVTDNNFTIKSDKEISLIRVTNIIGQDIYRVQYNSPQLISKILLDSPRRGMYLVVIIFSDNTRIVKKIMIEEN
jgi:hypothetical protein